MYLPNIKLLFTVFTYLKKTHTHTPSVCICNMCTGVKGNLTERTNYVVANILVTVLSLLLAVYFLTSQTYVMRADVIVSSILVFAFAADILVAVGMLTRLVRSVPHTYIFVRNVLSKGHRGAFLGNWN